MLATGPVIGRVPSRQDATVRLPQDTAMSGVVGRAAANLRIRLKAVGYLAVGKGLLITKPDDCTVPVVRQIARLW